MSPLQPQSRRGESMDEEIVSSQLCDLKEYKDIDTMKTGTPP
jgi:hypothetical protein